MFLFDLNVIFWYHLNMGMVKDKLLYTTWYMLVCNKDTIWFVGSLFGHDIIPRCLVSCGWV